MTNIIKALIEESRKEVWDNDPYNGAPTFEGYKLDGELLVELVVQECMDVAFRNGDNVDYLKQHFGIK